MKILITDDSTTQRFIIKKMLTDKGVAPDSLMEAVNGAEAFQKCQDNPISLVLMDFNMPEMNGLESFQAIRGKGLQTPVIMVTSVGEESRIQEALAAGVNAYITKPFSPENLLLEIRKYVQI